MQCLLPELIDTDQKHDATLKKLAAAESNLDHVRGAAQEAARRVDLARTRLQSEREKLTTAQRKLTDTLGANMPTEKFQQAVSGHRAIIDSLEVLLGEATQAAAAADKAVGQATIPIAQAQGEIANARFYHLIAELAKVLPPVIKITRELLPLGHQLGQSLEQSGLTAPGRQRGMLEDIAMA
jgi:hypothetical protein